MGLGINTNQIVPDRVVIPHADILTLPTAMFYPIIAAPGPNKMAILRGATLAAKTADGAYAGIDADCQMYFAYGDDDGGYASSFLNNAADSDPVVAPITGLLANTVSRIIRWVPPANTVVTYAANNPKVCADPQLIERAFVVNKPIQLVVYNAADFTGGHVNNELIVIPDFYTIDV